MSSFGNIVRRATEQWLSWFGLVTGILSAVSAISRLFEIGLKAWLADLANFYRQLTGPLTDLINLLPIPYTPPAVTVDFFLIYVVLLVASWRAEQSRISRKCYAEMMNNIYKTMNKTKDMPNFELLTDGRFTITVLVRCVFLIPILFLEPIRHLSEVQKNANALEKLLPALENLLGDKFKDTDFYYQYKTHLPRISENELPQAKLAAAQFIFLPIAIVVFFVSNGFL